MLKICFFGGVLVYVLFLFFTLFQFKRQRRKKVSYQGFVCQLFSKLDLVKYLFGEMKILIEHVDSEDLLSRYESMVFGFEQLLESISKVQRFGEDLRSISQSYAVVDSFERRARKLYLALVAIAESSVLSDQGDTVPESICGCYFCSRPLVRSKMSEVGLALGGAKIRVRACNWCFGEIKTRGKTRVLYFSYGEESVHWSKVDHYSPEKDFWKLDGSGVLDGRKLRLIYSKADQSEG